MLSKLATLSALTKLVKRSHDVCVQRAQHVFQVAETNAGTNTDTKTDTGTNTDTNTDTGTEHGQRTKTRT